MNELGESFFPLESSGSGFDVGNEVLEMDRPETSYEQEAANELSSGSAEFYDSIFSETGLMDDTEESTDAFYSDNSEIMEADSEDFYESAFMEMGLIDDTGESSEMVSFYEGKIMEDSSEDFYESALTDMGLIDGAEESSGSVFSDNAEITETGSEDFHVSALSEMDPIEEMEEELPESDFLEETDASESMSDTEMDAPVEDANYINNVNEGATKDDNQNPYRIGKELIPNNEYEINGYKYKTDDMGRVISAEGTLHMTDREDRLPIKDKIEDIGRGDELPGDNRGHLIGDRFDGSNGLENMIPQDADVNQKDYKYFENELANEVKSGKEVWVKVEPVYEEGSYRPTMLVVTYSIDGEMDVRIFPNSKEE